MSNNIRILFAIGSLGGGGAERVIIDQLKRLDRSQFTPLLYMVSSEGELLSELPADVPLFGFDQRKQQVSWNWPGRMHRRLVADMAAVISEQSIDLVFDHTLHMTLIAGPATERSDTRRVSLIACVPEKEFATDVTRFQKIKRRTLTRAYQTADKVIAVSEGVREASIEFFRIPPSQIITHYNSIDINRIESLSTQRERQFHSGLFHIVSCGRLHPQKGFSSLIQAAHILVHHMNNQNVMFHIIGEGPSRDDLTQLINKLHLTNHVILEGFQDNPFQLFSQAQLFCLSSLYEGFGLVLAEAMACNVPVLSTDCPSGPSEILDEGTFGRLIPPGNATALAEAIDDAISNYEQWKLFVPGAKARIAEMFGYESGMQNLQKILMNAVD